MQAVIQAAALNKSICFYCDDNALAILLLARNCIHHGWTLLNHPLYGNFRPHQQPFRSLLLQSPQFATGHPDLNSLRLIEQALLIYSNNKILTPQAAPATWTDDLAELDHELIRQTLEQSSLLKHDFAGSKPDAGFCPLTKAQENQYNSWRNP